MKLIYLHLYKDTYFIFMQAHKQLQPFLNYYKIFDKRRKMYFLKLKVFTISKIRVFIKSKA